MKARVLFFAGLKERFRQSEVDLEIPAGTEAGKIFDILCSDPKEAAKLARCTLLAINQGYAPPDTILKDGDEVALIPPVAGG